MGGDINQIRKEILSQTTLPVTTVPIYQAVAESGLKELTTEDILTTIHMQARQGVSSMVIHCVNERMLNLLREKKRILGMVSNGGGYHKFFHAAE